MGEIARNFITYNKVTTVFQKYPWKCAVDPLITLEIPLNFFIWHVWEPWTWAQHSFCHLHTQKECLTDLQTLYVLFPLQLYSKYGRFWGYHFGPFCRKMHVIVILP